MHYIYLQLHKSDIIANQKDEKPFTKTGTYLAYFPLLVTLVSAFLSVLSSGE